MPNGAGPPADFATHLSIDAARALVGELCASRRLPSETVELARAHRRVLARDMIAVHDVPPFDNSAMDGFAMRGADLPATGERGLRLAGCVLAGAATASRIERGECMRIMTGAPLPAGADTVVIKENARLAGDTVVIGCTGQAGAHVRPAGEDYRAGDVVARAGDMLTPALIGALAACGIARVDVARRPRVALLVTGDELAPLDQPLAAGQIHDSNRYSLGGQLAELGIEAESVAHLRDDPESLRAALCEAGARCDVVISSGGVSAGEADFLPDLVARLGRVHFWKVRIKPGMPVLCGEVGAALVFALPGNPVSTIVTFLLLVRPALRALQGAGVAGARTWRARLAAPVAKRHARTEFLRAAIEAREDGALWATPLRRQGSGMLRGVVDADALIVVPEGARELDAGMVVEIMPLPGLC